MSADTVLVRCQSHRARRKMLALVGEDNAQAYYSMRRDVGTGGAYRIPAEHAATAKAIVGGDRDA
jgi:hypothetical protein